MEKSKKLVDEELDESEVSDASLTSISSVEISDDDNSKVESYNFFINVQNEEHVYQIMNRNNQFVHNTSNTMNRIDNTQNNKMIVNNVQLNVS